MSFSLCVLEYVGIHLFSNTMKYQIRSTLSNSDLVSCPKRGKNKHPHSTLMTQTKDTSNLMTKTQLINASFTRMLQLLGPINYTEYLNMTMSKNK